MKLRNKKTGKIIEINTIDLVVTGNLCDKIEDRQPSLTKLNEEWEDYTPKEPLIRDKNERKAVKVWAYVNSIKEVIYAERPDRSLCNLLDMEYDDTSISFIGWIPTLKDSKTYTIAELCGEEE